MNLIIHNLTFHLSAIKFFDELILIYPLYVVMFGDYGVSELEIATLLLVWHVVAFSLEIPSGVWADRYSRKNILALGQFSRLLGHTIWLLFPNNTGFLVGFIFWGIKSAMSSGTFEALVYDELKSSGKEADYVKIIGQTKLVCQLATIIALFSGSYFFLFGGYQLVLLLSILSMLAYIALVLKLPEVKKNEEIHEENYIQLLKEGIRLSLTTPNIFKIIAFSGLFVGIGAIDEYWGVFAQEIGYSTYNVGLLFGSITLASALGSLFAYKFTKWTLQYLLIGSFISGLLLCLSAILYQAISSSILLIIFGFIFQTISTLIDGKLQSQIPSKVRATIGSVQSFSQNIVASLMFIAVGWIAEVYDYQTSFLAFGVILSLITLAYFAGVRNKDFRS